ncbi:hypothetical protein B6U99_02035 [Candidatus Geothermarchaeota archaeon ex4572_27]|nr:MAG: hypothetical protein B6U99_02035 [Candidatus Geothermarchaeota archaeon ex4572_27]
MARLIRALLLDYATLVVIGISAGICVSLFYLLLETIWRFVSYLVSLSRLLAIALVPLGITSAFVVVEKFAKVKRTGCGTHGVLEAYFAHNGYIHPSDIASKTLASAITMGFGGSAGPEGPSMLLGGGVAAHISRKLGVEFSRLRQFFIAGSAAGISAVFRAPLTGILFALEIPYRRGIEGEAFVESVIASVTAYAVFILINGPERIFKVEFGHLTLSPPHLTYVILLGIYSAVVAYVFVKIYSGLQAIHDALTLKVSPCLMPVLAGVAIGALALVDPRVLGTGDEIIHSLGAGEGFEPPLIVARLLALKIVATGLTLCFGGSGGLFVPTLVVGALSSELFTEMLGIRERVIFMATGMAAVLAAAAKTPLTAVALVAETCGPPVIIPASMAAVISYILTGNLSLFELQPPHKLTEEELALDAVYLRLVEVDPTILRKVRARHVMNRKPVSLMADESIEDALKRAREYAIRVYPLLNSEGRVVGVVSLEEMLMVEEDQMKAPLKSLARRAVVARPDDELRTIIRLMAEEETDHVFIVDEDGRLLGVIAEIDIVRFLMNELYRIRRVVRRVARSA